MRSSAAGSVLICSDQSLVVESVCAALVGRGVDAEGLVGFDVAGPAAGLLARHRAGVVLVDLTVASTMSSMVRLLEQVALSWLVLTEVSGPVRARLLNTGATLLSTSTTLDEVMTLLSRMGHDTPAMDGTTA